MVTSKNLASFTDLAPASNDFLSEVLAGLASSPKALPAKYFYDERGSNLFKKICELPEYYPTRTEIRLLNDCAAEIASHIGAKCRLIEYGTGSSEKMRIVLNALDQPSDFIAVDISGQHLRQVTASLAQDLPDINVHAICADFTKSFELPKKDKANTGKAVAFFPGSSIGNFDQSQTADFLSNLAQTIGSGGGLIIGVDLKKDEKVLTAAYDDSAGVTAAFNKNVLAHINRELKGSFDLEAFDHLALYNSELGRIEMHLVSNQDQSVVLGSQVVEFKKGEKIHTENSCKYHVPEFQDIAVKAGFKPIDVWTDLDQMFSVHYFEVSP
jgi:dimethylhistidine N-methyltransferase